MRINWKRIIAGITPPWPRWPSPAFSSTVQTTMERLPDGAAFVITGDIPAMWLRDSSAQVKNYLPFAAEDETVRDLLRGVIATQAKDVLLDAYANAFNREANGLCYKVDKTERNPAVWERKYEVDSLCAPILLAESYEKAAGDTAIYTADFHRMLRRIAEVFRLEQRHERSTYSFEREDCPEQDAPALQRPGHAGGLHGDDLVRLPALGRPLRIRLSDSGQHDGRDGHACRRPDGAGEIWG